MHGNTHVRNHDYIDHNRQAKQHTVLSSSHSCCKYHKTLLLVQLDMCLLLSVHIAQTRGFDRTHFSITNLLKQPTDTRGGLQCTG